MIPQVRNKPALLDYDLINEAWYRPFAHLDSAIVTNFMKAHPFCETGGCARAVHNRAGH